ncbi:hypothetical protein P5V93_20320 [Mycobacteroides abscessus subsp. abscessus]|uniref:hypothetical protein n=1 Tax=Mycobacteroides abscessus TaxID=36809 RepID=UPI001F1A31C7|nr:hypothetical protein [Mycobacteroides abscessus]MDO3096613.1 hypothetical protein [Mycobacteroides abscessus subsp. abscessus]MDO3286868.1 hypothetical protein [Mycobacteroides abscessus subsp. abscessus]MDO3371041.1 hypothetical protein [Mycobacteroides abscessus subsp. abscessus]
MPVRQRRGEEGAAWITVEEAGWMTWTKLSDDYGDDCWRLSDAAFRTHTEGLCWSNRKLLDLIIPKADVQRFAKHPEAVRELVTEGYWRERSDDYVIEHHAQYQRPRDKVINQQKANRANRAKRGKPTPSPREQFGSNESSNSSCNESLNGSNDERVRTGQGLGGEPVPEELPLAAGSEGWPVWRGTGPDPYEYDK